MNKIKLVQVIADSDLGGGPTHILGLLSHIDKKQFDCYLVCPAGPLVERAKEIDGVTIEKLPFKSKFDIQTILQLKKKLEKIQSVGDPFGRMIVHSHGPRAGFFSSLVAPKQIVKIFTEHIYVAEYKIANPFNRFSQRVMMDLIYRKSDCIIAVSTAVADYLRKRKVPKDKVCVVPNAIGLGKRRDAKAHGNGDRLIIGNIANLLWQKGHIYLIRAFGDVLKKYPKAILEIIGEGPERQAIEKEIESLNLQKSVKLLGRKKDVHKYLRSWKVFVLPSVSEPFGIVVLEAMQAGIPVVAAKVGGIVDIIENGKNGLLVESRNSDQIAKAVIKLLGDEKLAKKITKSAHEKLSQFDWKIIIKKVERVYHSI